MTDEILKLKEIAADLKSIAAEFAKEAESKEAALDAEKRREKNEARRQKFITVLRLRASGKTSADIGRFFGLSPNRGNQLLHAAERLYQAGRL